MSSNPVLPLALHGDEPCDRCSGPAGHGQTFDGGIA